MLGMSLNVIRIEEDIMNPVGSSSIQQPVQTDTQDLPVGTGKSDTTKADSAETKVANRSPQDTRWVR